MKTIKIGSSSFDEVVWKGPDEYNVRPWAEKTSHVHIWPLSVYLQSSI